jgi:hypothetical protein
MIFTQLHTSLPLSRTPKREVEKEKAGEEEEGEEEEGEDMPLATSYIAAMFAIFILLLSFILSSYGSQVNSGVYR